MIVQVSRKLGLIVTLGNSTIRIRFDDYLVCAIGEYRWRRPPAPSHATPAEQGSPEDVQPLSVVEDAAVARGPGRAKNPVQRVRATLQVA